MDTKLLKQFLLAAAEEPWEEWWNATRLIFADFLEENGKPSEAKTLRKMACLVEEEFPTAKRQLATFRFEPLRFFSGKVLIRIETLLLERQISSVWELVLNGNKGIHRQRWDIGSIDFIRIACFDAPPEPIRYHVSFNDGQWNGELSLERAQRRCRRRALEMFPNAVLSQQGSVGMKAAAVIREMAFEGNSPRWIPNEPTHTFLGAPIRDPNNIVVS